MASVIQGVSSTLAVLTVEFAPDTQTSRPPPPLQPAQASELAEHIAEDVHAILGDISELGLILSGGLYDLTEIIQPGIPLLEGLTELYRGAMRGGFSPFLMGIGSHGENFPMPALAPKRRLHAGNLLAVPFVLVGEQDAITRAQHAMEAHLLDRGRAGDATSRAITELFQISPVNLAYATFTDLCALTKVHLDHQGLGGLWDLIEQSVFRPGEAHRAESPFGNAAVVLNHECLLQAKSLDDFADQDADSRLQAFEGWLETMRQWLTGLEAHGIQVKLCRELPDPAKCDNHHRRAFDALPLANQDWLATDETAPPAEGSELFLTEHVSPRLGTLAFTVTLRNQASGDCTVLGHYYPFRPSAVDALERHWRGIADARQWGFQRVRPGGVLRNERGMLTGVCEAPA